ncbi:MAG: hypothetical protein WBA16_11515 [Nonlabens sp.]
MKISSITRLILCTLTIGVAVSCATMTTKSREPIPYQGKAGEYRSFYLLGNLDAQESDELKNFKTAVNFIKTKAGKNDFTLLLGDNVKADKTVGKDKDSGTIQVLTSQLELLKEIKGSTYVLPGNSDWNGEGLKGLKQIEELVEEVLDDKDSFQPEKGCPIEDVEISETVHLIIVDSQWYIADWNKMPDFNEKCDIKTREKFITVLADEMRKQRHKTVILAMHHPLYSNGLYGGFVSDNVLYRPSIENGYVPLLGASWSFLRSLGGLSTQDRYNPLMNDLMEQIAIAGGGLDRLFVISAHENNLQYIDNGNIKQIVSGTIHRDGRAALGKKGVFASGKHGFSELRTYADKSSQVLFYEIEGNEVKKVFEGPAFAKAESYNLDQLAPVTHSYIKSSIYPKKETEVTPEFEKRYGKHYRKLYGIEINAPVAMLDTLYGGLKVERAGGGNQTQGLRLVDSLDREYNMRALEKDAVQFLKSTGFNKLDANKYLDGTIPQELIRDFYTSSHPFGAFAVPLLAGAAGLNHTHPKLYYIPKQKTLGDFNENHGDRLYMIVEKPDDSFDNPHMFSDNQEVESTDDLFKKLREDEKYQLDERLYIRARIFDMLLGDWDRHEDQWRWAQVEVAKDQYKFLAIPRDRDQAFARFDGELLESLRKFLGPSRQFGNYGPTIEHIKEFSQSAMELDRALIQRTDFDAWLKEISHLQEQITVDVVSKAFKAIPVEAQDELWLQTQQDFMARKENLVDIVSRYYDHFLKFQTLKGTDKDDQIVIEKLPDGKVRVTGHRLKDDQPADLLFDRTFNDDKTSDLWIYALGDDDNIIIKGDYKTDMKIVVAGGKGKDSFDIVNGNYVKIYDYNSESNKLSDRNGAFIVLRDDYDINHYDSEKKPRSKAKINISNSYNPDYGYVPHLNFRNELVDYESNPYSRMYGLSATYHSLTQAAVFKVEAGLANVIGHYNLEFSAGMTTNNYTENFFGNGNGSQYQDDLELDEYRIFLQRKEAKIELHKKGDYGSSFRYGIGMEQIDVDHKESDNLVSALVNYNYRSVDDDRYPTRGLDMGGAARLTEDVDKSLRFLAIDPYLTFWHGIDKKRRLVLKNSIQAQLRLGDDPKFYQAARLGADSGLRGYHLQRFTGNNAIAATVDLLYDFKPIRTRLFPLYLKGYIGFDAGRVWSSSDTSNTIHTAVGTGIELSMTALLRARTSYFVGQDGGRLQFSFVLTN